MSLSTNCSMIAFVCWSACLLLESSQTRRRVPGLAWQLIISRIGSTGGLQWLGRSRRLFRPRSSMTRPF